MKPILILLLVMGIAWAACIDDRTAHDLKADLYRNFFENWVNVKTSIDSDKLAANCLVLTNYINSVTCTEDVARFDVEAYRAKQEAKWDRFSNGGYGTVNQFDSIIASVDNQIWECE